MVSCLLLKYNLNLLPGHPKDIYCSQTAVNSDLQCGHSIIILLSQPDHFPVKWYIAEKNFGGRFNPPSFFLNVQIVRRLIYIVLHEHAFHHFFSGQKFYQCIAVTKSRGSINWFQLCGNDLENKVCGIFAHTSSGNVSCVQYMYTKTDCQRQNIGTRARDVAVPHYRDRLQRLVVFERYFDCCIKALTCQLEQSYVLQLRVAVNCIQKVTVECRPYQWAPPIQNC